MKPESSNNPKAVRAKGDVLLSIRGLCIDGFSDDRWHEIVRGIDLTLARGEVLGLIGESGAGKSSVGLAAMGYAKPGCRIMSGQVIFENEELAGASAARKRALRGTRIAYVAQSAMASFNPAHKLIKQTIEAKRRGVAGGLDAAMRDAIQLYRELQLPSPDEIGFRFPHQVSGGQLQRAMTAMAMICKPDLIIFDEPTTALDVTTQVEVLATIRSLVEEHNTAAIYITHDLAVVSQMAHRIMVLRHGKTVEEAPTREMLANPRQEYTRSLWAVRKLHKEPSLSGDLHFSCEGLTMQFGAVRALDGVSITVPRGKTVCVVGESGSGKSTLARAAVGLLPSAGGVMKYNGRHLPMRLEDRDRALLQKIQLIHQNPDTALNPKRTVRDIVGRPMRHFHGSSGRKLQSAVIDLLERIELDEKYLDRLPGELSGGQKQRICIARALAARPELIICDEVTSALDQVVQEEILKLLMSIQQQSNMTFIFITHDIATVRAIADEVVVMNKGRVVEQGLKTNVLDPPYPAYTELLLSSVPEMNADWLTGVINRRRIGDRASLAG